jgi:hypothetical protein
VAIGSSVQTSSTANAAIAATPSPVPTVSALLAAPAQAISMAAAPTPATTVPGV